MFQTKNTAPPKQKPDAQPTPPMTRSDKDKEKEKRKERGNEGESSTRSTETDGRRMNREEIEALSGQEVTNAKVGKHYLG
jgi:hypothetical protein